jgi:MOSC domain-containing protein YiiM
MNVGTVLTLHTTKKMAEVMNKALILRCIAGKGIDGDRYMLGTGTYSKKPEPGRQLTIIESEKLEALTKVGLYCTSSQSRRNIVSRGISLNDLVGKKIIVGEVKLMVHRLCQPCTYLEKKLKQPSLKDALWDKGGVKCEILTDGNIKPNDKILLLS